MRAAVRRRGASTRDHRLARGCRRERQRLRALADRGARLPDDVRVIGFDDVEEVRSSVPSLSSVDPGHAATADDAVELLVRRIADPAAEPRDVVGEARVVERQSTGVARD